MTKSTCSVVQEDFFTTGIQMPARKKALEENRAYSVSIKLTEKCSGGCNYCYINSSEQGERYLDAERVFKLIEEIKEIRAEMILWHGGDPLLHPKWFEFSQYAGDIGISVSTLSSGIIPKREAKRLSQLHQANRMETVGLHLDTINPEAYNQINFQPKTLDLKIQGYYNLLEAGFPPQGIFPILTLTKPVCETIEETIDWFVDEMGAKDICFCTFEPAGFGNINSHLEPSIADLQRACEYRAKRLGEHYLRIGTTDVGSLLCRTYFGITFNGDVIPCVQLPELSMGNIYEKGLKEIFDSRRDEILFNFDVHGPCAHCKNSDVCYGCRASAYHYLGDIKASDPKCWLNTEAKAYSAKKNFNK